ncbi:MAG: GNAT family N-acetyltransferase [Burkholderiales bacterium]
MSKTTPVRSLAADAEQMGARAARHFERVFRTLATPQGGEANADWFRWITGEPHPLGNMVVLSGPSDADTVQTALAPLADGRLPAATLFPGGMGPEARDALLAAGFVAAGSMPAMAVDIASLAATALPAGYRLTRVLAEPHDDAWARTLAVGYGLPVGLTQRLSPAAVRADAAEDAQTQFFAVVHEDRIVGTSMLFLDDGVAGIYSVATLAEHRGRGIGAHLTAEPLRIAQQQGYRVGVLQSSPMGHAVYRGLGFADVGNVPMFVRAA